MSSYLRVGNTRKYWATWVRSCVVWRWKFTTRELKQRRWRSHARTAECEALSFLFCMPWRYSTFIAKFLYSYTYDWSEILGKTTSPNSPFPVYKRALFKTSLLLKLPNENQPVRGRKKTGTIWEPFTYNDLRSWSLVENNRFSKEGNAV